jgi:hypothetical protein
VKKFHRCLRVVPLWSIICVVSAARRHRFPNKTKIIMELDLAMSDMLARTTNNEALLNVESHCLRSTLIAR